MTIHRALTAASAAVLMTGLLAPSALAQTAAAPNARNATTQGQAARATGRPTTDAPAASQPQGAAAAVAQGTGAAPATPPAAAATAAAAPVTPSGDLVQTLAASGQFKTFLKALDSTNLTQVLKTHSNLTVFAPTDAAFASMPQGELSQLMNNPTQLQKLMTHQIINAVVDTSKFKNAKGPVTSVAGDQILLDGTGQPLKADNADIVQADVRTSNGVIHVVDHVLQPMSPEAIAAATAAAQASTNAPVTEEKPAAEPEKATPAKPSGTKRRR
ncbi:MAG TPA: fasciclin domain-containing protein [Phenylobacterium sp.]|uniref:fasciclin domain-containing protein n=1 Tax=Phenylobacterium sp. TaxID=1871053 RepID=UPI002B870EB3|nr:fasciclin domain-containing protein [Phenylobacterium sp.]HSV02462.1 fasciclin domain-containing protein [Phenylobacterium sp.]